MRNLALLLVVAAIDAAAAHGALAEGRIRLAQTSTVTNCMMTCNSRAATCQSGCVVPTPAPSTLNVTPAIPTPSPNPSAGATCLMACTSTQIACQTNCSRQSPSQ